MVLNVQDEVAGRLPPQNLEAEVCVLGSMLHDRETIGEVLLVLAPEDFYMPAHAEIYRTLTGLYDRGEPVDLGEAELTDWLFSPEVAQGQTCPPESRLPPAQRFAWNEMPCNGQQ